MFSTAETRWFYPGEIPDPVRQWFSDAGPPAEEQPPRVDHYRRAWGADVGVKWRQGRLEVKTRTKVIGSVQFAPQAVGIVECFSKQIEPRDPAPGLPQDDPQAYFAVSKHRWLCWYAVGSEGAAPAQSGANLERGCALELAQVELAGAPWWSLALEAFGGSSQVVLVGGLLACAKHVFQSEFPLNLEESASSGYAEWLSRQPGSAQG